MWREGEDCQLRAEGDEEEEEEEEQSCEQRKEAINDKANYNYMTTNQGVSNMMIRCPGGECAEAMWPELY